MNPMSLTSTLETSEAGDGGWGEKACLFGGLIMLVGHFTWNPNNWAFMEVAPGTNKVLENCLLDNATRNGEANRHKREAGRTNRRHAAEGMEVIRCKLNGIEYGLRTTTQRVREGFATCEG